MSGSDFDRACAIEQRGEGVKMIEERMSITFVLDLTLCLIFTA